MNAMAFSELLKFYLFLMASKNSSGTTLKKFFSAKNCSFKAISTNHHLFFVFGWKSIVEIIDGFHAKHNV